MDLGEEKTAEGEGGGRRGRGITPSEPSTQKRMDWGGEKAVAGEGAGEGAQGWGQYMQRALQDTQKMDWGEEKAAEGGGGGREKGRGSGEGQYTAEPFTTQTNGGCDHYGIGLHASRTGVGKELQGGGGGEVGLLTYCSTKSGSHGHIQHCTKPGLCLVRFMFVVHKIKE